MMIMLHVVIAVASLVVGISSLAMASKRLVSYSYGLIVATIATGGILMLAEPALMLRVCISGLVYTVFATSLTYAAQRHVQQLAKQTNK